MHRLTRAEKCVTECFVIWNYIATFSTGISQLTTVSTVSTHRPSNNAVTVLKFNMWLAQKIVLRVTSTWTGHLHYYWTTNKTSNASRDTAYSPHHTGHLQACVWHSRWPVQIYWPCSETLMFVISSSERQQSTVSYKIGSFITGVGLRLRATKVWMRMAVIENRSDKWSHLHARWRCGPELASIGPQLNCSITYITQWQVSESIISFCTLRWIFYALLQLRTDSVDYMHVVLFVPTINKADVYLLTIHAVLFLRSPYYIQNGYFDVRAFWPITEPHCVFSTNF